MSLLWSKLGDSWQLLSPKGFPDEATLHDLIEEAPQMLPVSGNQRLTIVGREVLLAGNYADLLAVEDNGRLAIIEIKLRKNAEARRAVVAQILTYAASLKGMDRATLEQQILAGQLSKVNVNSLASAVAQEDQSGQFDDDAFNHALDECLRIGTFHLVLVLDDAPPELVRLVGYLEAMTEGLIIDLITANIFDIGGHQVVVPRRIDPVQETATDNLKPALNHGAVSPVAKPQIIEGAEPFAASIQSAPGESHPTLQRLLAFARELEAEGLATLWTTVGASGRWILNPRLPGEQVGLVSIYNQGGGYLLFYRSVFERRAPQSIAKIESVISPKKIGQGTTTPYNDVPDPLLSAVMDAYREAAQGVPPTISASFNAQSTGNP
jgi:hypothetical protein